MNDRTNIPSIPLEATASPSFRSIASASDSAIPSSNEGRVAHQASTRLNSQSAHARPIPVRKSMMSEITLTKYPAEAAESIGVAC